MDAQVTADPQVEAAPRARRRPLLEVGFLALALALLALGGGTPAVRTLSLLFSSIVLEALPFMLLGALAGGLVEAFVSRERMASLLPRRQWQAVLAAAAMGLVFPVCECAVVPVVRRLARKGLPVPAVIAYLLGAPIANPIVAASTAVAYRLDWRVVAARVGVGYLVAVAVGLGAGWLLRGRPAFTAAVLEAEPEPAAHGHACGCGHAGCEGAGPAAATPAARLGAAVRHAGDDFLAVGHYFVIGAFVAALAQTFLDRSLFLRVTGAPALAIVLMMALAVAINLCSEADAFVASSFRGLVPLSAQLAFLLLGPILDLKLLLMYQTLFRRRVIVGLAAAMVGAVLLAALALHATGRFG